MKGGEVDDSNRMDSGSDNTAGGKRDAGSSGDITRDNGDSPDNSQMEKQAKLIYVQEAYTQHVGTLLTDEPIHYVTRLREHTNEAINENQTIDS